MINVWISYREEMCKEEKKIEMDPVAYPREYLIQEISALKLCDS